MNPGTLRISPERIYNGDYTQARNSTIQKMLRMVGFGDNIGSGFRKILNAWKTIGFPQPDIHEENEVNEVWLTLPLIVSDKISLVNSTVNSTGGILTEIQARIVGLMKEHPDITIDEIAVEIGKDRNAINYQLKKMKANKIIDRVGSDKTGRWNILI